MSITEEELAAAEAALSGQIPRELILAFLEIAFKEDLASWEAAKHVEETRVWRKTSAFELQVEIILMISRLYLR